MVKVIVTYTDGIVKTREYSYEGNDPHATTQALMDFSEEFAGKWVSVLSTRRVEGEHESA